MATSTILISDRIPYRQSNGNGVLQAAYQYTHGTAAVQNGQGGVFLVTATDADKKTSAWIFEYYHQTKMSKKATLYENGITIGAVNLAGTIQVSGHTPPYTMTAIQIGY